MPFGQGDSRGMACGQGEGVAHQIRSAAFFISSRITAIPAFPSGTPPPEGKRVTGFSVACGSLQHGYQRLTTICALLRSFKLCSLL